MLLPFLLLMASPAKTAKAVDGLDARLAAWRQVKMGPGTEALDSADKNVVLKLVEAARYMESIYWRQNDPAALKLLHDTKDAQLRRMILINGSRFDLVAENQPFVTGAQFLPGRNLYPPGVTRQDIEAYVREHPSEKDGIYSPYSVIRTNGEKLLVIPYRLEYRAWLEPAAKLLRDAAALTNDKAFADFLRLRADALLTDDYYRSDLAWVDLKDPKIDVIFEPNETYLDDVLGVKTSYEAAVLIRNDEESRKLDLYQKYIPDIQNALPLNKSALPSKLGQPTPMEVVDSPFRAGDLRHGYQAVADNLPNDARVHEAKGTKKIFFKNFMDARVDYVVLPLAKQVMRADQAAKASADGYLAAVVLHEICHGLGPDFAVVDGGRKTIREAIGPTFAALEEAKADVTGMFGLHWLIAHSVLPKEKAEEYYASYVAGIFRSVRYGVAEAHGRAEMMEFNFLFENGAIASKDGRYEVEMDKMPGAIEALTAQLLKLEATGDSRGAEAWFARYDKMPPALASALKSVKDVPIDIDPVFSYPDAPR